VLTDFGPGPATSSDFAVALALQRDGKIVAAGSSDARGSADFTLARYKANGALDRSFGARGRVFIDFAPGMATSDDAAAAVAIQRDGKIVAAGFSDGDFALARYTRNGRLDRTFGVRGRVVTDFAPGIETSNDLPSAVAIQPDGKIVAAGFSNASGSPDFALARYHSNGSLDTGFGTGGLVTSDLGFVGAVSNDVAFAVAVQPDGMIVAAGHSDGFGSRGDFALVRYQPDGTPDRTFRPFGLVWTDFAPDPDTSSDVASAVALQGDGKIVAVGRSDAGGDLDFALARYRPDGSLDGSFDGDGLVLTNFDGVVAPAGFRPERVFSDDLALAVAIQEDGKIVVAGGSTPDGGPSRFALARYNADGSRDASLGTAGVILSDLAGRAEAILATPRGIVVAGTSTGGGADFALARYLME
jgi:uncharacterized delta-60 repeat protein